jgi:hypothetical protein
VISPARKCVAYDDSEIPNKSIAEKRNLRNRDFEFIPGKKSYRFTIVKGEI